MFNRPRFVGIHNVTKACEYSDVDILQSCATTSFRCDGILINLTLLLVFCRYVNVKKLKIKQFFCNFFILKQLGGLVFLTLAVILMTINQFS